MRKVEIVASFPHFLFIKITRVPSSQNKPVSIVKLYFVRAHPNSHRQMIQQRVLGMINVVVVIQMDDGIFNFADELQFNPCVVISDT